MKVYYRLLSPSNWEWVPELKKATAEYLPVVEQTQATLKAQGIDTEIVQVPDDMQMTPRYTLAKGQP